MIKRIIQGGSLGGLQHLSGGVAWITPIVAVVHLPGHAQTTNPPNGSSDEINGIRFPADFSQQVLTCAIADHQIYYEIEICNLDTKPLRVTDFLGQADYTGTFPEITLNSPSLPFDINQGQCLLLKLSAHEDTLRFKCSDKPLVVVDFNQDKQTQIYNLSLSVNPNDYVSSTDDDAISEENDEEGGGEAGGGTATSTPPSIPPPLPPREPPPSIPPPSKPRPETPPRDDGTATSTAKSLFRIFQR